MYFNMSCPSASMNKLKPFQVMFGTDSAVVTNNPEVANSNLYSASNDYSTYDFSLPFVTGRYLWIYAAGAGRTVTACEVQAFSPSMGTQSSYCYANRSSQSHL